MQGKKNLHFKSSFLHQILSSTFLRLNSHGRLSRTGTGVSFTSATIFQRSYAPGALPYRQLHSVCVGFHLQLSTLKPQMTMPQILPVAIWSTTYEPASNPGQPSISQTSMRTVTVKLTTGTSHAFGYQTFFLFLFSFQTPGTSHAFGYQTFFLFLFSFQTPRRNCTRAAPQPGLTKYDYIKVPTPATQELVAMFVSVSGCVLNTGMSCKECEVCAERTGSY